MTRFHTPFSGSAHIAPLALFRFIFGGVMCFAVMRFILKGWVYELYIKPGFYFSYFGFEWIRPLGAQGMYLLFGIMFLSFLLVMVGYYYRIAIVTAFLSFTYIELLDKSNYLNHYYFISVVSFLLIFLPANRYFSFDTLRKPALRSTITPAWTIDVLKLQLAMVYIFAGIAKLNYDWLVRAMPLKIWLPANTHLPLMGNFMDEEWVAYLFSWAGAAYDLFIVFFLMNRKTRPAAYAFVIIFHLMTSLLFPIGMFPWIMILSTLIFFPGKFHEGIIRFFTRIFSWFQSEKGQMQQADSTGPAFNSHAAVKYLLIAFFIVQCLLPWRYLLYPGNLFWTEQGYRFSWRVMLMEKAGSAFFYVKDPETGRECEIMNDAYLTKNQEKMMATQPDMILQFAHFLKQEYQRKGIKEPKVRVESYVTLNGSGSRMYIDSSKDLASEEESFSAKPWILPFQSARSLK